jgi:hypothetical protein
VKFLEREAEKEAESDQQQQSVDGGRHGHSAVLYQRGTATDSAGGGSSRTVASRVCRIESPLRRERVS